MKSTILNRAAFFWLFSIILVSTLGFSQAPEAVPGEYLIRLKETRGVQLAALRSLNTQLGVEARSEFRIFKQFQVIRLPENLRTGLALSNTLSRYEQSGLIQYIEPNFIYHASGNVLETALDPMFDQQWGLKITDAQRAWDISKGDKNVVVAVIDTGVDLTHPDLADNIWTNPGEVPAGGVSGADGIDNDGNGFIDDLHGWNFYSKNANPNDDMGHGTHCAGVIAGGHNGVGMMGIAPNVRIMPVKFLGAGGDGTLENGILATEYAMLNHADIMSNSWGGDGFSKAFFEVIEETNKRGIVYVAAAGNDHNNNDTEPTYPASYQLPNIISVAATDSKDDVTIFTSWGPTSVHLAAPGLNIWSAFKNGKYKSMSGTSMACPHVAGAAALLKSAQGLSAVEIKERLMGTVDFRFALQGRVASGGRLNLYNALMNIHTPVVSDPENWQHFSYSVESPHPYPPLANLTWTISHPGAKFIKVHFGNLITAEKMDGVIIRGADGRFIESFNRNQGAVWSRPIEGDMLEISLRSDSLNEAFGFQIDSYAVRE
ncbi:S8 family serine peptidase [Bdellovibrionota bacterium FG-2]